jgi:ammonia channel protein AmtB
MRKIKKRLFPEALFLFIESISSLALMLFFVFAVVVDLVGVFAVDVLFTFRLSAEDERMGADLAIHKIGANPEDDVRGGRAI